MLTAGILLSLFGWLWSVWRGFRVSLLCGLLNFFFHPLSQLIFCLYEKSIRRPTLVMFIGWVLVFYSSWQDIHVYMQHQMQGSGHGIAV
jgi:hypothetical protein